MRGRWGDAADSFIMRLHEDLGETATLDDRKRMLRAHAGEFHCGTSWGKKVWSRRARVYLERYGLPARTPVALPLTRSDFARSRAVREIQQKMLADDITFPFRQQ